MWTGKAVLFAAISQLAYFGQGRILSGIPSVGVVETTGNEKGFTLSDVSNIVIDNAFSTARDEKGQTLIPPSLEEFGHTFASDVKEVIGTDISVTFGTEPRADAIFLTLGSPDGFLDVAGRKTSEGYSITVDEGVRITGASPLGVWWGTRTLLQMLLLGNKSVPAGTIQDSPGWGQRGMMLDVARHYYKPEFLVELCSYMSFFKQNTLHLHLNDNLWNNPDLFDFEAQMELYAAFRLLSHDPRVAGLNNKHNESYTREDFDIIQTRCAARGVTILPEFDAPGHSLVFSQWKPEIGMSSDYTLLNLSHPDTMPALKTVWDVFLPWFHTKTVSIGADEYRDAGLEPDALVEHYQNYVNDLNEFITKRSGKKVRIWGTFPPSSGSNVNKSVSIQHWANFEAYAKSDWLSNGYNVMNSGDDVYVVSKWSSLYLQELNQTFIFHGSPGGGAFAPNIFDPDNATENVALDNPFIEGHIVPLWTDWGPNSTTALESYYSWRNGLPALADKQWGGDLSQSEYSILFEALQPFAPGVNLDRHIPSLGKTIIDYDFSDLTCSGKYPDRTGNKYDAESTCPFSIMGTHLSRGCQVTTPLSSKGRDYTLSFSIMPTSNSTGPLFTGSDSALWAGNGTLTNVTLVADGAAYTLNYTFPAGQWTNASLVGKGSHTYLDIGDGTPMEFLTKMGIRGRRFVWGKMAIEAPLHVVGGGGFEGVIGYMRLEDDTVPSS